MLLYPRDTFQSATLPVTRSSQPQPSGTRGALRDHKAQPHSLGFAAPQGHAVFLGASPANALGQSQNDVLPLYPFRHPVPCLGGA